MSRSIALVFVATAGVLLASCSQNDGPGSSGGADASSDATDAGFDAGFDAGTLDDGGTLDGDGGSDDGSDGGSDAGSDGGFAQTCSETAGLGEFVPGCDSDADCHCPFVCAPDPTRVGAPKGICARPCTGTADCPAIGTKCEAGACVTNTCTPAGGAYYGPCDAQGAADGTCIPRMDYRGTIYGGCIQAGSATTSCRWPTVRSDTANLCDHGSLCLADGNTRCQALCDPTVAADTLCPFGTVCKPSGDPVRQLGVCKDLGPSGCTIDPIYGTELSKCTKDSDCACPQRCVNNPRAGYSVCQTPCSTTAECTIAYTICNAGACTPNYCFLTPGGQPAPGEGFGLSCDAFGTGDGVCVPVPAGDGEGGASTFAYGICMQQGTKGTGESCSPYFLGLPRRGSLDSLCKAGNYCFLNFSTFASTCGEVCDPTAEHPCKAGQACLSQVSGISVPGQRIGACGPCVPANGACLNASECCSGQCDLTAKRCL